MMAGMEPEVAVAQAADTTLAALDTGAGNVKEREKSALLERMEAGDEIPAVIEEEVLEEVEAAPEVDEETAARNEALAALEREFPEALVEGSELFVACREELEYLREAQSPLADDPQAEYKIARRMTRLLPKRAPVPEPAKPAPRRKVRPLPAGNAPVDSVETTLERRLAGAKSTGQMLELMREIGTPFEALLRR